MKVTILDDWFDTLRALPCFSRVNGHQRGVNPHIDIDACTRQGNPAVLASYRAA